MDDLMNNSLRGTLHNLELSMMNEGNYGPVRDIESSEEDEDSLSSNLKKSSDFMEETRARMRQLEMEAEVCVPFFCGKYLLGLFYHIEVCILYETKILCWKRNEDVIGAHWGPCVH